MKSAHIISLRQERSPLIWGGGREVEKLDAGLEGTAPFEVHSINVTVKIRRVVSTSGIMTSYFIYYL